MKASLSNYDIVGNFIQTLDKIGITREPASSTWRWGGKGNFPYAYILELSLLHRKLMAKL